MSRARTAQAARVANAALEQGRALIRYGVQGAPKGRIFEGFDADTPVEGFYAFSLRSGAVKVGVRIWHGPPADPHTGEPMDRSWRWQATANGEQIDLERVWPQCARSPISEADYQLMVNRQAWAKEYAPRSAFASPTKKYDPLDSANPLPF